MEQVTRDPETGDVILGSPVPVGPESPPELAQHGANLALYMDEGELNLIGQRLTEDLSYDLSERGEWEKLTKRYIDALGIGPESDPDDYEYEFANTSDNPLLTKALTAFQAKALSAVMPSPESVARVEPDIDLSRIEDQRVRSAVDKQLAAACRRVEKYYNWYLIDALPSYVEDTDLILQSCGLEGLGVRRICVDPSLQRTPVQPRYVPLENLIFSYDTKNFRAPGRLSERYTHKLSDIVRAMQSGRFRTVEVDPGIDLRRSDVTDRRDRIFGITRSVATSMHDHVLYDVFTYLFIESDLHPQMIARPYVVTIHATSQRVLGIYRNWDPADPDETPLEHYVGYVYSPGRNALSAIGLGALLTNITMALRTAQRRGLDAAYLANHPSGFVAGGVSIRDGNTPFVPGTLRSVDIANGDLQRSILINPFKGPDPGLIGLYDRMEAAGKELGNIASIDFAAMMKSGIAAGPALAAYDESTEFQTSVHRRLYRAHSTELRIIHDHMRMLRGGRPLVFGANGTLEADDLFVTSLRPAMRPGHVSRQRAIMEGQMIYELAKENPQEMPRRPALINLLSAIGVSSVDAFIVPDPEDQPPPAADPVTEYGKLLRGDPIRAAPHQNHRAHIDCHAAQLRMLATTELPREMGDVAAAMLGAHIAEHEALDLAVQVAQMMGMPYEALEQGIPPEVEGQLAEQMAAAIQQIEAARSERDDVDPRVMVEQIRSQSREAVESMRAEQAELNRQAQVYITQLREDAATYRNITDNLYGIEIAQMRETGSQPAKPDIPNVPLQGPRTEVPRFRFNR